MCVSVCKRPSVDLLPQLVTHRLVGGGTPALSESALNSAYSESVAFTISQNRPEEDKDDNVGSGGSFSLLFVFRWRVGKFTV